MDFEKMAREVISRMNQYPDSGLARASVVFDGLRAAFAAGSEAMREDCQRAVIDALHPRDTWQPSYLGGYTDAMRLALGAIRALPGKEGE